MEVKNPEQIGENVPKDISKPKVKVKLFHAGEYNKDKSAGPEKFLSEVKIYDDSKSPKNQYISIDSNGLGNAKLSNIDLIPDEIKSIFDDDILDFIKKYIQYSENEDENNKMATYLLDSLREVFTNGCKLQLYLDKKPFENVLIRADIAMKLFELNEYLDNEYTENPYYDGSKFQGNLKERWLKIGTSILKEDADLAEIKFVANIGLKNIEEYKHFPFLR